MGSGQRNVFVDESKVRDYLLISVGLDRSDVSRARASMTELVLSGQSRIHMRKESDPRRRSILSTIATLDTEIIVVRAVKDGRGDTVRRGACMRHLVPLVTRRSPVALCLERDETLVRNDRQWIVEALHASGVKDQFSHRHESAAQEPLLALPDAIGWAWAKGGEWRQRCGPGIDLHDV